MSDLNQRPFSGASFNQYLKEHKLMASRCQVCQDLYLPPRAICPACHSDQMAWYELSGRGELAAFTAVYIGPSFMNEQGFGRERPYLTGVVALQEGVKISARLLGFEELPPSQVQIGTLLTVEYLELGDGPATRIQLAFRAA
jgi:hypothetical protein